MNESHHNHTHWRLALTMVAVVGLVSAISFLISRPWRFNVASLVTRHSNNGKGDAVQSSSPFSFDPQLIESLNLIPIVESIASYTGTRRGYVGLMNLVLNKKNNVGTGLNSLAAASGRYSLRQQRIRDPTISGTWKRSSFRAYIAQSASEATQIYSLVKEADLVLRSSNSLNITFPPLYGAEQTPFSSEVIPDTDDDDWLDSPCTEWNLENIIEAEQIVKMLLNVYEWSDCEEVENTLPGLARIGQRIEGRLLQKLHQELDNSVEIVRVRTVEDPTGRNSFEFRLGGKFTVLNVLRRRRDELISAIKNSHRETKSQSLIDMEEDIRLKEDEIQRGLVTAIHRVAPAIDAGLNLVGELDVIFAKAAYGICSDGCFPIMKQEGVIDIQGFVHPLLRNKRKTAAVPIDLKMSTTTESPRRQALIISGPNAGGKTLALKSFGIACLLAKIGVPIVADGESSPRVDFFDSIHTSVGDAQDIEKAKSTYTGQLIAFARLFDLTSQGSEKDSQLLLLDELGTGTDADEGGAIAQSVLEKLIESSPTTRIVATTHSNRIKTLSFQDDSYDCASVLVEPIHRLEYGLIGESHALRAAKEVLPLDVLERASQLVSSNDQECDDAKSENKRALLESLAAQLEMYNERTKRVNHALRDIVRIRSAMALMAAHYDTRLSQLETRVEHCYEILKESKEPMEILGETLDVIRASRIKLKSQQEILREKGLKPIPHSHCLVPGESVVIITEELSGVTGIVVEEPNMKLGSSQVAVIPSFSPWGETSEKSSSSGRSNVVVLDRKDLAFWDYDYLDDDWSKGGADEEPITRTMSKARLDAVLSDLNSSTGSDLKTVKEVTVGASTTKAYTSARERKAASKKASKRKRRRK